VKLAADRAFIVSSATVVWVTGSVEFLEKIFIFLRFFREKKLGSLVLVFFAKHYI